MGLAGDDAAGRAVGAGILGVRGGEPAIDFLFDPFPEL